VGSIYLSKAFIFFGYSQIGVCTSLRQRERFRSGMVNGECGGGRLTGTD
jgi:hypothetical protein